MKDFGEIQLTHVDVSLDDVTTPVEVKLAARTS
jgi:hypothetical protein